MGYKTKIQVIERKQKKHINKQFYIMCPAAVAQALEIQKGEEIEWIIEKKDYIVIKRNLVKQRRSK